MIIIKLAKNKSERKKVNLERAHLKSQARVDGHSISPKHSLTLVLLKGLAELVDLRGHLQSLHQNSLLSLDADVARPFNEAGEVALWLDVSSKSEIFSTLLEERS